MNKVTLIARILIGLVFFGGGISFFLSKPPELPPGEMADFFHGMMATHYFFNLLKVTEILCGLALLVGRFVPLALVILAPIIINIFCVHVFLDPKNLPLAVVIGLIELYLAFFSAEYSPTIKGLFRAKV